MMQQLMIKLFALLLAASATLFGVLYAFERTAAKPDFYSAAINQISLTGFAVPLAEKLTGQNGKAAQVLQLGMNRLEPQLKQQTAEHLQRLFSYLRGNAEKFDMIYDMSALQTDSAFANEVVEALQKDSKLGLLPKNLLRPVAQKLTRQLPEKLDLLTLAGLDAKSMASLRRDAQIWFSALDRWLMISAELCLLLIVLIFLLARSFVRTLTAVGLALLVAACLLTLPWIFSDRLLAAMQLKGPVYELLQQTGLWQALAAELSKSYQVSPIVAAVTAAACLFLAFAVRLFNRQTGHA